MTRESSAKCVNGKKDHVANYKGCPKYKEFMAWYQIMIQSVKDRHVGQQQKFISASIPATNTTFRNGQTLTGSVPAVIISQTYPRSNTPAGMSYTLMHNMFPHWKVFIHFAEIILNSMRSAQSEIVRGQMIVHFQIHFDSAAIWLQKKEVPSFILTEVSQICNIRLS